MNIIKTLQDTFYSWLTRLVKELKSWKSVTFSQSHILTISHSHNLTFSHS